MEIKANSIGFDTYSKVNNSISTSNKNITKINEKSELERSPITDSVSFQSKKNKDIKTVSLRGADELRYEVEYNKNSKLRNDVDIIGDDIDVNFKTRLNGNKLTGNAYNHNIDLEYVCKGFDPNKMTISGRIDNRNISLKYNLLGNNVNIEGDISDIDEETLNLINMMAKDYAAIANNQLMMATIIAIA